MSIRSLYLLITILLSSITRAETFSSWQTAHFTLGQLSQPLVCGVEADPDGDGITNLLEYAYASEPWKTETGILPVLGQSQNHLTLKHRRLRTAADLFFALQASDDLVSKWKFLDNITISTDGSHVDYDVITISDPQAVSSENHRFLRLMVAIDTDEDGLPDDWELQVFGNLDHLAIDDDDFDTLTNLMEYRQQTNPSDFYNGHTPKLQFVSGDGQIVAPSTGLSEPFVVQVLNAQTLRPLTRAPVRFLVNSGGGSVSSELILSDADGFARTYFTAPEMDATSVVNAIAGNYVEEPNQITPVSFTARSISPMAPTNLTATIIPPSANVEPGSLKLQWKDNADTETGYIIERQNPNGSWSEVGEVPANTTEFDYFSSTGDQS